VSESENQEITHKTRVNKTEITLIGTAHVSQKSVDLVEKEIYSGKYDCIAVELCQPRYNNIIDKAWWRNLDIYEVFRKKKAGLLLVNLALSGYQKRLADKLGVEAGQEMQRAIELAKEKKIRLELIDRDITVTLNRIVNRVTFWQKIKFFTGLIASIFIGEEIDEKQIEDLKKGDMLQTVVEEFGEELPAVKEVLIDERDEYMTGKLNAIATSPNAPSSVVAMIGAGHLIGMMPKFSSPPDLKRLTELEEKPKPSKTGYYVGWSIGVFIMSMFAVGYNQSPEIGLNLIITWIVINGGLSALGAAIALAHPLSILSAFIAAPITSLNPSIGAGMVVGLVETYLRKPKVADFEALREDIGHFKNWFKNRVVRVFLIFFMANLGSAIGTYIAGASIINQIFS
jgi:pheromone shutdown-related protein TraB